MLRRDIQSQIQPILDRGKIAIIMGPRQSGKSTLLRQEFSGRTDVLWLNGDTSQVRQLFPTLTPERVKSLMGPRKVLVIDEAQRVPNIGLGLKIIADNVPEVSVVATGSSSFALHDEIKESLAGRKRELMLPPLSFGEMVSNTSWLQETAMLPQRLITGYYPEVVTTPGEEKEILEELNSSSLYRDVLAVDGVKKSEAMMRLTRAIAYQIGSQVSMSELANLSGLDSKTVEKYVNILEQCYVIFRLGTYSRNLRNELTRSRKIFFWDLGMRNAVLGNFAPLEARTPEERGALWENFLMAERAKRNLQGGFYGHSFFWRSKTRQEVDYLEEMDGRLRAWEFKWNPTKAKVKPPSTFAANYPDVPFTVITPDNFQDFLL